MPDILPAGTAPAPSATDVLGSARDYAAREKADATRRAYRSDWQDFVAWCDGRRVAPLPAEPAALAAYAAGLADRGRRYSTIRRRVAAIAYAHRLKGYAPPDTSEPVKAVLRGIRRTIGVAVTRKAPATARVIAALVKRLPDTLAGNRDRALLLIGFAAAMRRSELVALDVAHLSFSEHGVVVAIPKSKADQEGKGQFVAIPNGKKLKPVEALRAWLDAAGVVDGAVFRGINKSDRLQPRRLTDRSVANIIKKHAAGARLDPAIFSGHSLRAGFVTQALDDGEDPFNVRRVTRHVEIDTLLDYDRRAKAFKDHAGRKFL